LVFGSGGITERATSLGHLLIKYIEPKLWVIPKGGPWW
jgi:hypothetical protein